VHAALDGFERRHMLRVALVFLALIIFPAASGKNIEPYFRSMKHGPVHVYSPGMDLSGPMGGKPILPSFAKSMGLEVSVEPFESIEYFGVMKVQLGKDAFAYILREPGRYVPSVMGLYFYDNKTGVLKRQLELADEWGDAGYIYEKDSWLVDVDGDGYLDVVRKELQYDEDIEDHIKPTTIQKTVSIYLYRRGGYESYSGSYAGAEALCLKYHQELWQKREK
jgi:hypothetical protein